jgi:hypothetical protein
MIVSKCSVPGTPFQIRVLNTFSYDCPISAVALCGIPRSVMIKWKLEETVRSRRIFRNKQSVPTPGMRGVREISAALAPLCFFVTVGCVFGDPPGIGPTAELGYQRAAPVIEAIGRYRKGSGRLPRSLRELVPKYLKNEALEGPLARGSELGYRKAEDGYELFFRYIGPGTNTCTYASWNLQWRCSGGW